jgi:hypothetical protein
MLMTMAVESPAARQQVIDGLTREMASIARELAEVGLTADLAIARHDWECIYTASERLLELQRSWAGIYRRLLVVRIGPSRLSERTSV